MEDPANEIRAMDEALFQLHGSTCKMWVPPEVKNPVVFMQPNRKSVGYFGAVRIEDGRFLSYRPDGMFNAETTWNFLKQLEAFPLQEGQVRVIILDNAKYHHGLLHKEWRAEMADHFRLVYLPPYSPELNPSERVWKITRQIWTHNHTYPDLASLEAAISSQFSNWSRSNDALRRLCAIN
jgi:transposase